MICIQTSSPKLPSSSFSDLFACFAAISYFYPHYHPPVISIRFIDIQGMDRPAERGFQSSDRDQQRKVRSFRSTAGVVVREHLSREPRYSVRSALSDRSARAHDMQRPNEAKSMIDSSLLVWILIPPRLGS